MAALVEHRIIVIAQPAKDFLKKAEIKARKLGGAAEKQIYKIISSVNRDKRPQKQPEFLVTQVTGEELLTTAERMSANNNDARNVFKSVTLIEPEAEESSISEDPKTGIKVVKIKSSEPRFPNHPSSEC